MDIETLKNEFGVGVRKSAPMREYTTFRLGGACGGLVDCVDSEQMSAVAKYLFEEREPFITIGEGSNILVADQGVETAVIRFFSSEPEIWTEEGSLRVGGGTRLADLCAFTVEQGYTNFVYCAGIPGTVGGALVGNAGAYGRQIGDELIEAQIVDFDGEEKTLNAEEMEFEYRDSILKHSDAVLVSALFKIEEGVAAEVAREWKEIMDLRRSKHPDYRTLPTAGSFFRNIEPSSAVERRQAAGWFLEEAGAKEMQVGGAAVFEKHANIIVKANENCTSKDVLQLSRKMRAAVKDRFGFGLEREIRLIGDV